MNKNKILDKIMEIANAVGQNKYLSSISGGLMGTLPILMMGSVALLLAVLPIKPYTDFISAIGLQAALRTASRVTTNLIALYAAFTIAYRLADKNQVLPLAPALLGAFCFFVTTPMAMTETDASVSYYLDSNWMGAKGLFAAIIAALLSCKLYCFLFEKKITIKMPDSVESIVASSFASLVPAIITAFTFTLVSWIFTFTPWGSFTECIYTLVSLPLSNMTDSIWCLVILVLVQQILWFLVLAVLWLLCRLSPPCICLWIWQIWR